MILLDRFKLFANEFHKLRYPFVFNNQFFDKVHSFGFFNDFKCCSWGSFYNLNEFSPRLKLARSFRISWSAHGSLDAEFQVWIKPLDWRLLLLNIFSDSFFTWFFFHLTESILLSWYMLPCKVFSRLCCIHFIQTYYESLPLHNYKCF